MHDCGQLTGLCSTTEQLSAQAVTAMAARYRILLITRHPVGGIRTFFRYVYRRFDRHKYRFTLVCPDEPEARVLLQDLSALDVIYVPLDAKPGIRHLIRTVHALLRRERFDLIHSHGFTAAVGSALGATLGRVPHVITCHDVLTNGQFAGPAGAFKRAGLALAMASADAIHCVSHDARDNLLEQLKLLRASRAKLTVIPNGIESQRFLSPTARDLRAELGLGADSFLIGFFGRFMSQKGFAYLVDALDMLVRRASLSRQPIVLAFGDINGFRREEEADVRRKGLSESIRFLPFVADIGPSLKGLDVVAMPSLWEACGLLAMEALVAGVPLIGTDCVGLREVLFDTPATVVPVRDSAALSAALAAELESPTTVAARAFAAQAALRFDALERAAALERLILSHLGS